jgi:hypothetical protein
MPAQRARHVVQHPDDGLRLDRAQVPHHGAGIGPVGAPQVGDHQRDVAQPGQGDRVGDRPDRRAVHHHDRGLRPDLGQGLGQHVALEQIRGLVGRLADGDQPQPRHVGGHGHFLDRGPRREQVGQAGPRAGLEHRVQCGTSQVGVDQDDRTAGVGQRRGQVGRDRGPALPDPAAGHQQDRAPVRDRHDGLEPDAQVTVGLGRGRERGAGEDGRRTPGPARHPRDHGQHRRFQAPLEVGPVAHPVIQVVAEEDRADAQDQAQDRADRQQDLLAKPGR